MKVDHGRARSRYQGAPIIAGYRVVATLTSATQKIKTYLDVIFVGIGRA